MEPGAMAMKKYSSFSKAPALLEPYYQIVLYQMQDNRGAMVIVVGNAPEFKS